MAVPQIKKLEDLKDYLSFLEKRIETLEYEIKTLKEAKPVVNPLGPAPSELPDTNLLSHSFIKRAFAVWGHYFVSQFAISVVVLVIYLLFAVLILLLPNIQR